MEITVAEEPFFFFPKLESFTDKTFNTFVRKEKDLLTPPSTPFVTYLEIKIDSNQLSLSFSDDDFSPLWIAIKIRYEPIKYGLITQYIALLYIVQSKICELFSYNEAMESPEAHL